MNKIQNQYIPDYVSPPGETLLEVIEDREVSQVELAKRMGRPKKTINEIIQGKTTITPETALQLERVLGVSASFWNNREQQYRQHKVQANKLKKIKKKGIMWRECITLKKYTIPTPFKQVSFGGK